MGPFYFILALLIQNSYGELQDNEDNQIGSREILKIKPEGDDSIIKDFQAAPKDWMDMFIGSNSKVFPTSSAALMAQATFSDKTPEEQLEDIKEMANQIKKATQSEIANLLSYAISVIDKEDEDNKLRSKRSIESPMDSTQLVMRLLKHIKSNNEYQNIAIEKMMTAQEIADKYGIDFSPDPEILTDLAIAANEQAKEMSDILKDSFDLKNVTKMEYEPMNGTKIKNLNTEDNGPVKTNIFQDSTNKVAENSLYDTSSSYESPDSFSHYNYYHNYPYESQIPAPPTQHNHIAPVSPRPDFYDYISFNPYCSMDPVSSIFFPMDEPFLPEPELVGEEYEETVSSKVYIDHEEEPGLSTVNHVMTYTVSEKAHYRSPQIESLPQQMQYYFFLIQGFT